MTTQNNDIFSVDSKINISDYINQVGTTGSHTLSRSTTLGGNEWSDQIFDDNYFKMVSKTFRRDDRINAFFFFFFLI